MKKILLYLLILININSIAQVGIPVRLSGLTSGGANNFLSSNLPNGKIYMGDISGIAQAVTPSGDITSTNAGVFTVGKLNGVSLAGLASGLLKNTTGTGVPTIAVSGTDYLAPFGSQTQNTFYASPNGSSGVPSFRAIVAADIPTLNQNTTGSAGSVVNALTIPAELSAIGATSFNGSAARTLAIQALAITNAMIANGTINLTSKVTGILPGTNGGTGVNNGAKLLTLAGNTTIGSTTNTVVLGTNGNTSITLPTSGTIPTLAGIETFTNKRWVARTGTTASSATPTVNSDNTDLFFITALATNITSMTTNLSGAPNIGDVLEFVITGTATRTITWGSGFCDGQTTIPTTTSGTTSLIVFYQFLTTSFGTTKWHCMSKSE